tara:strand:- start:16623 stop:17405 length:783 start_codon:yes stop_codon:yes gene_type:complete
MINSILHFSDLHLKLYKGHEQYRNVLRKCFKRWEEIKPDRIVFTGDLVHSKNQITPELIEMVRWVLNECSKISKTLVLIGNHDFLENNLDRMDSISPILSAMKNDNIVYLKDRGTLKDENITWCIYSLLEHNKRPNFTNDGNTHHIGLFHGPIQGTSTDMGFAFEDGYSVDEFDGCDIVLAGDIHKRQIIDIPNGKKAYMVGSLIQQNFGETIKNHGFGLYDVKKDKYSFEDIENLTPYINFKIEDITDIENAKEKITNY